MNNGTVEFTDFEGTVNLELPSSSTTGPKKFREPSVATILLGRLPCPNSQSETARDNFLTLVQILVLRLSDIGGGQSGMSHLHRNRRIRKDG